LSATPTHGPKSSPSSPRAFENIPKTQRGREGPCPDRIPGVTRFLYWAGTRYNGGGSIMRSGACSVKLITRRLVILVIIAGISIGAWMLQNVDPTIDLCREMLLYSYLFPFL
jgi:hypothetical protein